MKTVEYLKKEDVLKILDKHLSALSDPPVCYVEKAIVEELIEIYQKIEKLESITHLIAEQIAFDI